MPAAKLKVYRTAIGFHDAFVAAPSQKAALEAWGSDKNLFARGAADLVTDPALTAEPLANPGKVIKRLRGTAEEQIAALPPDRPKSRKQTDESTQPQPRKEPPKPKPRPSRSALEAAEAEVDRAERAQAEQREALAAREAALAKERRALERSQADELETLRRERDREEDSYRRALREWKA
jgi:hypothetical protein